MEPINGNRGAIPVDPGTTRSFREPSILLDVKRWVQDKLIEEIGDKADTKERFSDEHLRNDIRKAFETVVEEHRIIFSQRERESIISDVTNEVLGLGPIEPLIQSHSITEIMVNGPNQVYVERDGKLELTEHRFLNNEHVIRIIEKIVSPIGRRIDESSPMVDARLKDGSRVNAIIPPLSLVGPCLTIRKFSDVPYSIQDLIKFGTMSEDMATLLNSCVLARLNIIVTGGTGSGKTSTLNAISSLIPGDERIITIEDAAELQLQQKHVVTLESRQPNIEGKGAVTIRDLVSNTLRMRPDRIVVGEVRSGEALDMLQAMNTGHDGSLTTAHANSPNDVLARLETMVLMGGMELPVRAVREQVAGAINIIIHQERMKDGKRRITHITEVAGISGENIILQDLFLFNRTGVDSEGKIQGNFHATGIIPKCIEKFKLYGVELPEGIFSPNLAEQAFRGAGL